jgi:hypothetical protein
MFYKKPTNCLLHTFLKLNRLLKHAVKSFDVDIFFYDFIINKTVKFQTTSIEPFKSKYVSDLVLKKLLTLEVYVEAKVKKDDEDVKDEVFIIQGLKQFDRKTFYFYFINRNKSQI